MELHVKNKFCDKAFYQTSDERIALTLIEPIMYV